jgi:hypothetical protein
MSSFTVVYDANVLYPAPLRDLLMRLALTDLFRARWTERIHDEWIRNVLLNSPDIDRSQLERTKQFMNTNGQDCFVTENEMLIDNFHLPDENDHRVLAAAIMCGADEIITFNLNDFQEGEINKYGFEAITSYDWLTSESTHAAGFRLLFQRRPHSGDMHQRQNPYCLIFDLVHQSIVFVWNEFAGASNLAGVPKHWLIAQTCRGIRKNLIHADSCRGIVEANVVKDVATIQLRRRGPQHLHALTF